MNFSRREFCATGTALAASACFASRDTRRPLRVLILGGTRFLGVHLTRLALSRGHEVTLFNRGQTNPHLFPEVRRLRGDRDGQLDSLREGHWDCVIDDSGYIPRHVELSTQMLAPRAAQYLFISSNIVYASFAAPNDETSPLAMLKNATLDDPLGTETYGPFKALCEIAVRDAFPHGAIVLRPGFIVGPEDVADNFAYWPVTAARGGEFPVPGAPSEPIQLIDVRDVARFALDLLEKKHTGTFNVVSPPRQMRMGELIADCVRCANRQSRPPQLPMPVWVPLDFLDRHNVVNLSSAFPLWPRADRNSPALALISSRRAQSAGLRITPLATTVADTLASYLQRAPADRQLRAGLLPEEQQKLLAAWHRERQSPG
jgi:2'-hydroxyisoflavone reductase